MGGHLLKRARNMEASQLLNWSSLRRLLVYLRLTSTFSEAYMLHLILGIDFWKNEVRLEATERSKRRDSSDHRTGCSTWRVAQHKTVRRTLEIWYSLCRAVYKLQFNVGYAHIELQKRKCPTDLCSCVGMWGVGWVADVLQNIVNMLSAFEFHYYYLLLLAD